jgi:uncharacterized Zn finger protein
VSESVSKKASRYVSESRVTLTHVDADGVRADVRGHGNVYAVTWSHLGWTCSCPARRHCAHVAAVQLVTVREPT